MFTPSDGQVLQNGTLVSATGVTSTGPLDVGDLGPPCLVAGTLIEAERGLTPNEDIEVGDLVRTLDHGLQPVRWRGSCGVSALDKRAPIRFAPGAIGNSRELLASPQHKILMTGWRADLFPEFFGTVGAEWAFARPVMAGAEAKVLCGDRSQLV